MRATIERVPVGHGDGRRVIYDLIRDGDAGGGSQLYQLSYFTVFPNAQIGGTRKGFGHFHKEMYETYVIISGACIMSLHDLVDGDVVHMEITVIEGVPIRVIIPPNVVHRLSAVTDTFLLIAATGPQTREDTFEVELP